MKITDQAFHKLSKITNSFYEDFKIEFLYHSNHIEGSSFTRDNIETLLFHRKVEGIHLYNDVVETMNTLFLFDKVIQNFDQKLDKSMLFDWHRILKKGSLNEEIHSTGKWKLYENYLRGVDIKLASPHEVDTLMDSLLMDWMESDKELTDIVKVHYRFEKIHPF